MSIVALASNMKGHCKMKTLQCNLSENEVSSSFSKSYFVWKLLKKKRSEDYLQLHWYTVPCRTGFIRHAEQQVIKLI